MNTNRNERIQSSEDKMERTFKANDKVYFETVMAGTIKAKVVRILHAMINGMPYNRYLLQVTTKKNPIYPCKYEFEASPWWMIKR
jgi:hypothetical protein